MTVLSPEGTGSEGTAETEKEDTVNLPLTRSRRTYFGRARSLEPTSRHFV